MPDCFSADWSLEIKDHIYWRSKEQFMLDEDTYDYYTLFAVEDGSFRYEIGSHQGEAKFGDLVLCPPGVAFKRKTIQPLSFHYVTFVWVISQPAEVTTFPEGKITIADTARLTSTYRYMRHCINRRDSKHYIKDIWHQHARELGMHKRTEPRQTESTLLNQALCHIHENVYEYLNLGELAAKLDLTPVQLTRQFRSAFGQTPSEYITELRLRRVCRLLEDTSLNLDQIAGQCGYENGYYLSRVFTRKKAVTPSQYRKAHQV
ncbi:AraC family transcriptional regulator [Paenibacillus ginsengarvi]|uniref:AraC family transcriptional regulator n=1 Tax=Paenibacillus ginsengarvi TaxID=400777 RepID=A0A3B0CL32_9BACL|nr:AraC family transcriptional regulator [Paenibacillus ginsengarvi]RKN85244.1 AraC family transcriptional regulator [Paenibacillus ginsengarvi]